MFGLVYFFALSFLSLARSQTSQTLFPAAVPLAVRSPYLSAWQNTTVGANVPVEWPQFSQPSGAILGWAGMIRIDSKTYRWLGDDTVSTTANLTSIQVTPTQTIYTVQAGPMDVVATFLSPIEPSDWVRQSTPFCYLSVNVSSRDGESHSVQIYSDISAEWLSGNRSAIVTWNTITSATNVYHQIELQDPSAFTEIANQAEDGTMYYSMAMVPGITYQNGEDSVVRTQFAQNGQLTNGQDTDFRGISNKFPVFGISVNLGSIKSTSSPVVWALGYVRNPSIKYTTGTGQTQLRSPYYAIQYSTVGDLIEAFLLDYNDAMTRSLALDSELASAATAISPKYNDLVTLAARQAFGGIDITVGNGTDGNWNMSDVMIFMKNVGGTSGRVNPVEVLYAAFPMFLYFNASFGKPLLAPLLEFQDSPLYTLPYAASDLGDSYPVASGDNATSSQGVEQSGNMLIMALAHARASGDGSLISQHYDLLKNWTTYLEENAKTPYNQDSADGQSTANMTNLAIKGIIGIKAMSEISLALSKTDDAEQFSSTASAYVSTWQSLALSSSSTQKGVLFTYGDEGTWALIYNLYADRWLQTNLVDESIYNIQAEYYSEVASGGNGAFGLPFDSASSGEANSAWLAFTASSISNTTVRDTLLDMAWTHAASNITPGVFPTEYSSSSGQATSGYASPAQGAMFAPLALSISNQTIQIPPPSSATTTKSRVAVGAIVGGVVGGVACLALIVLAALFYRRRKRQALASSEKEDILGEYQPPDPFPYESSPFSSTPNIPNIGVDQNSPHTPLVMSTKLREHMHAQEQATGYRAPPSESSSSSSAYASTAPSSSRNPPSTVDTLSPQEIIGLRTEVENLRRVMQELHADRMEAPPEYGYEG